MSLIVVRYTHTNPTVSLIINSKNTTSRTTLVVGQLTGLSVYNLALSDGKWQSSRPINRPVESALYVRDSSSLICNDYAQPHLGPRTKLCPYEINVSRNI